MDWKEERDKFWESFDLWDDANEPVKKKAHVTYRLQLPMEVQRKFKTSTYNPMILYLDVDTTTGELNVGEYSYWFGKHKPDMMQDDLAEIYDYLVEWEYAEWRAIGPEDSEIFATDKLTDEER